MDLNLHKIFLSLIGALFLLSQVITAYAALPLSSLRVPLGYQITIYASNVPEARQLTLGVNGVVFVGTRHGNVYALLPNTLGTKASSVVPVAIGLDRPNGVAFYRGDLYIADINRLYRLDNIMNHLVSPPKPIVITDQLPNKRWHGYRYLKIGPDGYFYTGIGVPCNSCVQKDPLLGTITRLKPDGSDIQVYAKGVRNSVGFDWHPDTHVLWFTDNGQDFMGDDLPPDELNRAPRQGMDFGFPYFYGDNHPTPKYGYFKSTVGMTVPALNLPAHVAALGMTFYEGDILIAEHGSWNRAKKVGYQVIRVRVNHGKVLGVLPFVSGWLQGQAAWGRPVDILHMPDGALLISDDKNGVIYRIFKK